MSAPVRAVGQEKNHKRTAPAMQIRSLHAENELRAYVGDEEYSWKE
jgi:hypothetical protein